MTINSDYIDILRCFVEETVQFLVVGGYAVMKHSEPYNTKDLWIAPNRVNAERAYRSLARFGAPLGDVTVDDLLNPDLVRQTTAGIGNASLLTRTWRRDRDSNPG